MKTEDIEIPFINALSGIYGKDFFFEAGMNVVQLAKRNQVSLLLAIIDIDDLALLNDRYSYDIADEVIRSVAMIIKGKCRKSDLLGYLEEGRFGLLLYNSSGINANIILDTIRKNIEYNVYNIHENKINVTVSIGASIIYTQAEGETLETIYDKAYMATNNAKGKGKNCVVVY